MAFSFGTTPSASAPAAAPSAFSFGGNNAASAPGSAPAATSAAPTTSSAFSFGGGAPPATSSAFSLGGGAAPATSSSFSFGGGAAPATSSSFGFGGTSAAPAPATSSSFSFGGNPSGAPTTSTAPSTGFGFGLGGSTTTAASTAPAASGGLFGAGTNTSSFSFGGAAPSTGATSSLFGGAASQPTGATGIFGGLSQPTTTGTSGFGGFGGFGATSNLAAGASNITLESTFEQLPQDVQKNILEFRDFLKEQDRMEVLLNTASAKKLHELKQNMHVLEQELLARRNVQERLQTAVLNLDQEVKSLNRQSDLAALNMRCLDYNLTGGIVRCVEMPSQFYWDLVDNLETRMDRIQKQLDAVELELQPIQLRDGGLESSLNPTSSDAAAAAAELKARPTKMTPILIQHILQAQNAAFMAVAARVAEVHERADLLREQFVKDLQQEREKHGEYGKFKDPFSKQSRQHREDDRKSMDRLRFRTCVTSAITTAPPQSTPQTPAPAPAPAPGLGFGFGASTPATPFGAVAPAAAQGTPAAGTTPVATPAPSSGFSFGAAAAPAPAPAGAPGTSSSFKLGGASTGIPKQVSFNLQPSTPTPLATGSAGSFGNLSSPFLPGAPLSPSENKSSRIRKAKTKRR